MPETRGTQPRVRDSKPPRELIGQTLGNYRIVSEIGEGGMGVVYLAEHTLLKRKVAVKVLRKDVAPDLVERFFTEAKAAASLHHPGLVDVFDFGHDTSGSAYIVMEYLAGESLAERLERDPRLPIPLALAITRSVANALQVAHDLDIVHRDLKPGNIFLVEDKDATAGVRTKVLDFGIAKLLRDQEPRSVRTHSGALMGTPRYMSPEQCKNAKNVDGRSDIYSLGCILFEMLIGVAPFDYDTWGELVGAHLHEHPPSPRELDPTLPFDIDTLLAKMLQKKPEDRHRSMLELAQSLEVLLHEHGGVAIRMTPAAGLKRPRDAGVTDPTLPAAKDDSNPPTPKLVVRPSQPMAVATEAPRKRPPWIAIAFAFVGIVGVAIAFLAIRNRKSAPTQTGEGVVTIDNRQDMPDAAPASTSEVVADAAVAATPPPDARVATVPRDAAPRTEVDTTQLKRSFDKRNSALTACFKAHPEQVTGELGVRFQIDARGKVLAVEVVPATVASTPLGKCLADVARGTSFGPQPKGATFRIPITTRN